MEQKYEDLLYEILQISNHISRLQNNCRKNQEKITKFKDLLLTGGKRGIEKFTKVKGCNNEWVCIMNKNEYCYTSEYIPTLIKENKEIKENIDKELIKRNEKKNEILRLLNITMEDLNDA